MPVCPVCRSRGRLGNRPNLRQMHDEACRQRVTDAHGGRAPGIVDRPGEIPAGRRPMRPAPRFTCCRRRRATSATTAASATSCSGPRRRRTPENRADWRGASSTRRRDRTVRVCTATRSWRPSCPATAWRAARHAVRGLLGWEEVRLQLDIHMVDPVQNERLRRRRADAERQAPDIIRQAYSIVVTVDEANDVRAFKLSGGTGSLFAAIKADTERARIMETAVDAEALLPGGPFDLWRDDEDARFVRDLAGAFTRQPRLPKMLQPRIVLDTVMQGVERGLFVARLTRPDGSARTWWREAVAEEARGDPQLEVVLPAKATLTHLDERLLAPGALPALWTGTTESAETSVRHIVDYFTGGRKVSMPAEEYEEHVTIPGCKEGVVHSAVQRGVEQGALWLTNGPASVWKEPPPYGTLDGNAVLHPPPDGLAPQELTMEALPGRLDRRPGERNLPVAGALATARPDPAVASRPGRHRGRCEEPLADAGRRQHGCALWVRSGRERAGRTARDGDARPATSRRLASGGGGIRSRSSTGTGPRRSRQRPADGQRRLYATLPPHTRARRGHPTRDPGSGRPVTRRDPDGSCNGPVARLPQRLSPPDARTASRRSSVRSRRNGGSAGPRRDSEVRPPTEYGMMPWSASGHAQRAVERPYWMRRERTPC